MADRSTVRVVCRLRPENQKELSGAYSRCVEFTRQDILLKHKKDSKSASSSAAVKEMENHQLSFDRIYGPDSEQAEIFSESAKPVIDSVFEGYNGTIFAYGQTSSGKTYTMEGLLDDPVKRGIIPRVMESLFNKIEQAPENMEFIIKCSMLEIYMERIQDLLDPRKANLQVKGNGVPDLSEEYVSSQKEMEELIVLGANNRQIAATGMNEKSSRSHSLFIINITKKDKVEETTKSGRLYLVDLAGSEKVGKTHCVGQQLEEAKAINKSLSALGNVIKALTEKKKGTYIPYRDSKLTHILQESIGGNSLTLLIITCSMSSYNAAETLSTLRFGSRAKKIQNKPMVNSERSAKKLMKLLADAEDKIKSQSGIIAHLQRKISLLLANGENKELGAELKELFARIAKEDVQGINKLLQNGYVEELKEAVSAGEVVHSEEDVKLLKTKMNEVLKLQIELTEARNQLESLESEKLGLESEVKSKCRELSELEDRLKLVGIHAKREADEHLRALTQLELGIENISFMYQQRNREIDQLCKSLDRLLFDENLMTSQFPHGAAAVSPGDELDQVRKLVEDQPKKMLKSSLNNTITMLQRIQAGISEDQTSLNQLAEQVQALQSIPSLSPLTRNQPFSTTVTTSAFPERFQSSDLEFVSSRTEEERKAQHTTIDDVHSLDESICIQTEPARPLTMAESVLGMDRGGSVTSFVKAQKKTIEDLNAENLSLRDQIDGLQRKVSKSSFEAVKQVQTELTKAFQQQKEESARLKEQLDDKEGEAERVRAVLGKELAKKDADLKRATEEMKLMKEYVNKLITTHADKPKVVALEKKMNEFVVQLSSVMAECDRQRKELDSKDQESQKLYKFMKKLELESKKYASIAKYHSLRSRLDGRKGESVHNSIVPRQEDYAFKGSHIGSSKIVKPIKGGAPVALPPKSQGHRRRSTAMPGGAPAAEESSGTVRGVATISVETKKGSRVSLNEGGNEKLASPRQEERKEERKDSHYSQNLKKFSLFVETQKKSHKRNPSSEDEDSSGNLTERPSSTQIGEKLFRKI